jgi:hypothetical protein
LSLRSSAKTAIYPNSLILEREVLAFLRRKGRVKNLPISMAGCNTHFLQEQKFCANRSAYKNAYQIIVHMKNFPKINLV